MFTGVKLRNFEWFSNQSFRNRSSNTFSTAERSNHSCKCIPHILRVLDFHMHKTCSQIRQSLYFHHTLIYKQAKFASTFLLHLDKTDLIQFIKD